MISIILLLWPNDGEYKWEITEDDFSDDDNDPDDSFDFNIQNRNAETDQDNWLELIQPAAYTNPVS